MGGHKIILLQVHTAAFPPVVNLNPQIKNSFFIFYIYYKSKIFLTQKGVITLYFVIICNFSKETQIEKPPAAQAETQRPGGWVEVYYSIAPADA